MEFLGDAVLEYLMTSYLYSAYPDLKPGQITDLKSLAVNNNSFAYVAIKKFIHKYLIKDSKYLMAAVNKFEKYVNLSNSEKDLSEEPACPKVKVSLIMFLYNLWMIPFCNKECISLHFFITLFLCLELNEK